MASETTAIAAASDNQDKDVTGHPVTAIPLPATQNVASPVRPLPPPRSPVYLYQLFRQNRPAGGRNRFYLLSHDQLLFFRLGAGACCVFVAMAIVFVILWLLLRPHLPAVEVASVSITPLSITPTNNSNSKVSATCNISILLTNPNNKLTVFYDSFQVFLHYRREKVVLSDIRISPFSQPAKTDTLLHTYLDIDNAFVEKDVVEDLKKDLDHGLMSFGVKIFSLVRLESKGWKAKSQLMKLYCPDLVLGFSALKDGSGYLLNPFETCMVAL